MEQCDRFLIYLHRHTWRASSDSPCFAREVEAALELGVPLLLAHEMTGLGQGARHGCEFATFFECDEGATPPLLIRRGIYEQA